MKQTLNFLAKALATTVVSAGLMLSSPAAFAANATLNGTTGNSCDYSAVSIATNGDITVTCGAAANMATLSIGAVAGSLSTTLNSNASFPVTCSGTCADVAVSLAVTAPASGVALAETSFAFASAGSHTFFVNGTAPLAAGNASVVLSVTAAGTGVTTSPPVGGPGTLTKLIPIVDATAAGTLSFSPTLASVTEGGPAVTVSVLRTGSGTQAATVTVPYSCAVLPAGYTPGFAPAASGTLTWTDNDATAKTISITPTTVPDTVGGTVTCTLGVATGEATVVQTPFVLTVNKAGGGSTCPTVADVNYDLSVSADTNQPYRLASMKTVAIKFAAFRGGKNISRVSSTFPAPGENSPVGFQMAVSECPGDFTTSQGSGCVFYSNRTSAQISFGSSCTLDPAKKYYLNVRFVNPTTGASTCSKINCGAYSNLNY